ncbi:MAG: AAA family ATPase [Sandaracinaceae bacterium]|nr:AAA family ATPase [Sandaracinaceae bacterium]MBK8589679.1 AAA family ATPase [Sandaracinaceae bacterium]MBP7682530.1 AAA family ATPase [Deltaproteobacteria bacterium]
MSTLTLRLEAYDPEARQLVAAAQTLADERRHPEVEPLHLLYLLLDRSRVVQQAIERLNVDSTDLVVEAELLLRRRRSVEGAPSYLSPRLLDLLGRAEGEAARDGGVPVSVLHLMLACGQETSGAVRDVFGAVGVSAPVLRAGLTSMKTEAASAGRAAAAGGKPSQGSASKSSASSGEDVGDPLEEFGRDLTRLAAQGKFDPTVGRDAEIRRMLQVLARRRENNPLLVGEAGIGKTSIVQALAMRIATGDVPTMLKGKRIVALDMGSMVAGAKLRGQLEERMRRVLDTVRDSGGEILLFIPDLGAMIGGQDAAAGGLLATALARGELRAIAIATPATLRKAQDENATLLQRFVGIPVEPPTIEEAIAVLRGVVGRFEADHGVRILDPALVAAAQFARRYVTGVQLPKSAVDLIDEAAARVRVEMESVPSAVDAMTRRLEALEIQNASLANDDDSESVRARTAIAAEIETLRPKAQAMREQWQTELASVSEVRRVKQELQAAERELEQVRASEDHGRAGELRFGTIPLLEKQLAEASAKNQGADVVLHDVVHAEDVADVVAAWTGVPVAKMLEAETEKLLQMEVRLGERVIGQDHAVTAIAKAVRRGRIGMRDPKKPIGSFLFLGPTGVGKTELAKALAEFLFDDEASLTRLDMSEFMEKQNVARLLGAPLGYKDSDAGGQLTEAVRQRPYSVVLFDEMEKAHPDVFNVLLQVLDDGRLTDSRGRLAHFSDTVVIMTSNIGSHLILDHEGDNASLNEKIEAELHRQFKPEFLNRIDEVIIFNPLSEENLLGIAKIQLRGIGKMLAHRRITLDVTEDAQRYVVELGYDRAFGARPLKRVILKQLQDPLAEAMLKGGYGPGDQVKVSLVGEGTGRSLAFAKV